MLLEHTLEAHVANEKLRRMEADLRRAQAAQLTLLPRRNRRLPGLSWDYRFAACEMLSGDGLELFSRAPGEVVFGHFDVCGHGVEAALHAVAVQRLLRCHARPPARWRHARRPSPRQIVAALNRQLPMERSTWMFSLFVGVLDVPTGHLAYCRAGHPAPLLRRSNGEVEPLEVGGMLVGIETHQVWEEGYTVMNFGDRLLVYSDCVVDAARPYGEERLARLVRRPYRSLGGLMHAIERDLRRSGVWPPSDDFSLLCLERYGRGRACGAALTA